MTSSCGRGDRTESRHTSWALGGVAVRCKNSERALLFVNYIETDHSLSSPCWGNAKYFPFSDSWRSCEDRRRARYPAGGRGWKEAQPASTCEDEGLGHGNLGLLAAEKGLQLDSQKMFQDDWFVYIISK